MWIKKLYNNPARITITTCIACVLAGIIGAPIADAGHSGGEAVGITFFAIVVHVTWYITIVVAIITLFFYRNWVRKYWYKNAIIIVIGLIVISNDFIGQNGDEYNMQAETMAVNGTVWLKTTEYYGNSFDTNHIRSVSFLLDERIKDSTWTTFAPDGTILEQKIYKQGKLIRQYTKK